MNPRIKDTILKLVFFSLVIGLFLGFFDVDPLNLMSSLGETARDIFSVVASVVEWAVQYVLLGAIVVVPIWLVFWAVGRLRGKG